MGWKECPTQKTMRTDRVERVREVVMFIERNKVVIAFLIGMALGLVFGAWFGVILDLVACWSEVP